jgi:hypothetical protein
MPGKCRSQLTRDEHGLKRGRRPSHGADGIADEGQRLSQRRGRADVQTAIASGKGVMATSPKSL